MVLFNVNLAEEVASHTVPSDSKEPPTFDSGMETDEATENAPKALLSVDLPNLPAGTPLVGPSEDATAADIDMSSGYLDNAVAPKEDTPSISALTAENFPVEASAATHGRSTNFFIQMMFLKFQLLKEILRRNMSITSRRFPPQKLWNRTSRMVRRRWNHIGTSLTIPYCQSSRLNNHWRYQSPRSRS
jgi:hypothetical protein